MRAGRLSKSRLYTIDCLLRNRLDIVHKIFHGVKSIVHGIFHCLFGLFRNSTWRGLDFIGDPSGSFYGSVGDSSRRGLDFISNFSGCIYSSVSNSSRSCLDFVSNFSRNGFDIIRSFLDLVFGRCNCTIDDSLNDRSDGVANGNSRAPEGCSNQIS